MGFGHRVYKNYDPRAKIVKQAADECSSASGPTTPCSTSPWPLEEIALADDYFI